jgi:hypothetical protein
MNNAIKNILILGGGIGIGAFSMKMYLEKKCEAMLQEEIASVKEVYERKNERAERKLGKKTEAAERDKVVLMKKDIYEKKAKRYAGDEEDPEHTEYENMSRPSKNDPEAPYVISYEEFAEEMNNFEKLTLNYYEDDDVLTDEEDGVVTDVIGVVGDDALTSFGDRSEDPEVVYVRNEKLETDYEVIRLSKSFAKDVLGYDPDDGVIQHPRRQNEND